MSVAERLEARTGMPVERRAAAAPRGGVLLVGDPGSPPPHTRADALLRLGFTTAVPALAWRLRDGDAADVELLADHEVIADLSAARELLPGPRFVVGVGAGGLYARLAACAVLGLDGAVGFGGRVSYPGVSARRPIQPLDLLPGLHCPLQCHFDEDDPDAPPGHVDELERRLAGVSTPWQVFRYGSRARGQGWASGEAETAWGRARSFLLHVAAERR